MIHPCNCKSYNGDQCYNCLNGAHEFCDGDCQQPNDKTLGLPIKIIEASESMGIAPQANPTENDCPSSPNGKHKSGEYIEGAIRCYFCGEAMAEKDVSGAEEEMTKLLIKYDSMPLKPYFAEHDIYKAMKEYGKAERLKTIEDCQTVIDKIKLGLQQMVNEAPNMLSPDGRFGQRAEDRNHGIEQGAKLALTMVKLIEEKELEKLKNNP